MSRTNEPHQASPALPRPALAVTPSRSGIVPDTDLELLVKVSVDFPDVDVDRKPLSLALVIDRSGSMSGDPLEGAKAAAHTAVDMLLPGDWVSIVTYDNAVGVPVPLVRVERDRTALHTAIRRVSVGGTTALHAGWAEGLTQVMSCPDEDVVSRVVLLSDGLANVGITDPTEVASDVADAHKHGVTTSAMGLGRNYDEALLRSMADAGLGNYVFIESSSQLVQVFENELAGLSALRGRNVRLQATRPAVLSPISGSLGTDQGGIILPDMVAGLPFDQLVTVRMPAGSAPLSLALTWDDAVTGQTDEEAATIELPLVDADTFATLPVHPDVVAAHTQNKITNAKQEIAHAARSGDAPLADKLLHAIQAMVPTLPEGLERDREVAELERLLNNVKTRDFQLLSRGSEKGARDRVRGRRDKELSIMAMKERAWRQAKMSMVAAAKGSSDASGHDLWREHPAGTGPRTTSRVVHEESVTSSTGHVAKLQIVVGDITDQADDAIVNSTNRGLFGRAGVDGAIHRRAGPDITAATSAIGSIQYGEAVFTQGFALPARFVIHTATPPWGKTGHELDILAQCYAASLQVAQDLGAKTLAFPAIGTGTYGYPPKEAAEVAVAVATRWLQGQHGIDALRFVVLGNDQVETYLRVLERNQHAQPSN